SAGDTADAFYMIASGRVRVVAENREGQAITLSTLGTGQHFGEEAAQSRAKRTTTARAASEAVGLSLPAEAFQRWIDDHIPARDSFAHFLSHATLQHFLKRFPALGAPNASELSELVDSLTVESFPAGASVVSEGGPGDALYIVQSGVGQV